MVSGGVRAVARCDALGVAPYSDMEGGLFRAYLTPAYAAAQGALAGWMEEAGMSVRVDPAANLIGRYEGLIADAPPLLIGSHLDSVKDGGRYDGPLGIMLGVEAVDALHRAGKRMPFPVEVIAFGDEEGSRFPAAMLTSRAVAGVLEAEALDVVDGDGVPLEDALSLHRDASEGWHLSSPAMSAFAGMTRFLEARRAAPLAYLEAHIEQGPVLEAEGLAVGTVTGIAAQLRYQAVVTGQANHAGTTTMTLRRDALAGAAEMLLAIERIAKNDASDLVATVGRIEVLPAASNVIPGEARFTIDIRSGDPARRDRAAGQILAALEGIARARGLTLSVDLIHDLPASPSATELMDMMDAAIADAGQPPFRLVSGAGHDAMVMAALCPTGMLFIRCRDGVSHNPAEHVDPADAEIALQVMLGFIDRLGGSFAAA
ncbi:allantoate amidohydrolase [Sphingobium sp. CCH11-B1]|jgi:allantoate deiminase|uniref:allantoate amidohydrolase n=1 Tax=Sphingobium sp. CCH11-B1 TaxID=1768781 RepID=UPI00082C591B|nr:allantoate amidohydrolase [Sphingobium sp. CCH11-B1]MEA3389297.1 allantoate amidohydrolase [Pseudomonadota bacterium]